MIKFKNKKKIFALLIVFILIFQQFSVFAAGIKLQYDGKTISYNGNIYQILINKNVLKTDLPGIVFNKTVSIPVRAVFEKLGATAVWNNKTGVMNVTYKTTKLQFTNNSSYAKVNGKSVKMVSPAKKINERLIIPASFLSQIPELKHQVDDASKIISIYTLGAYKSLNYNRTEQEDDITINASNMLGYNISRQVSTNKLVLDLKNVKGPTTVKSLAVNGKYASNVSVSSAGADTTRLTIQLTGFHNYSVETTNSGCILKVIKSPYPQMSYYNNLDKVFVSLNGIKLTDLKTTGNDTSLVNLFTEKYNGNQYTITVATSSAINMPAGEFNVGDSYLDKITVGENPETGATSITFKPKSDYKFFPIYNDKLNRTEINILRPAKKGEQLVFIDAGHGGVDPGTVKKNVNEKDLNLDIALRLEKLLKAKKIKTYVVRQDDTYVGLYDRPWLANALNATLLMSIHNNSSESASAKGTETLYANNVKGSLTSSKFADILQSSLVSGLKSNNRKTVERPNLVVLKYAKMPACISEIGFLTNTTDRNNLSSATYRQKTAQALCNAIVKSLNMLK